jgi:energy-converting hydrogenase Eha subunit C
MTEPRNPADLRREARAALEARIAAGRPFRAGESRGMGIIVAIAIVFGGIVPVVTAFARPFVTIAGEMADFAPVGLLLLGGLLVVRARRRHHRALAATGVSLR